MLVSSRKITVYRCQDIYISYMAICVSIKGKSCTNISRDCTARAVKVVSGTSLPGFLKKAMARCLFSTRSNSLIHLMDHRICLRLLNPKFGSYLGGNHG